MYNQKLEDYTRMGCPWYGLMNIVKYKFGIIVKNNTIITLLKYMERIWIWSSLYWGRFDFFYNAFVNLISRKLDIKLKVVTTSITRIDKWDTGSYWIWIPNYYNWKKLIEDWKLDEADVIEFMKYNWKTYWHHLIWDWSWGWFIVNSDWWTPIKCPLNVLKSMARDKMIWNVARTLEPADDRTRRILSYTLMMRKAENLWTLDKYLETNEGIWYIDKAKELYFYD